MVQDSRLFGSIHLLPSQSLNISELLSFSGKDYTVVPHEKFEALRDAFDEDEMDITAAPRVLGDAKKEFAPLNSLNALPPV